MNEEIMMDELMQDIKEEKKHKDFSTKACFTLIGAGVALVAGCVGRGDLMDAVTCGLACGVSALVFGLEAQK